VLACYHSRTQKGSEVPSSADTTWAESQDAASLINAILSIEDAAVAERFLRDLCTNRELEEMVTRWAVVRRLATGDSYRTIHEEIGVSTATVTRINDWLRNGSGGYAEALERVNSEPPQLS
jgi:TrpR-related protein YerC/YecD